LNKYATTTKLQISNRIVINQENTKCIQIHENIKSIKDRNKQNTSSRHTTENQAATKQPCNQKQESSSHHTTKNQASTKQPRKNQAATK
jgi:hypothetical protein